MKASRVEGGDRLRAAPRRWIYTAALIVAFAGGGVVGGAVGAHLMRARMGFMLKNPHALTDHVMPGIRSRVGLSEEQAVVVEGIVRRRRLAMRTVGAGSHAMMLADLHGMRDEVANELEPDQTAVWKTLCERVEGRYLPHGADPPDPDALFQGFDANGDESLSEEEVFANMWRFLRLADHNDDGRVTRAEYEQAASLQGQ